MLNSSNNFTLTQIPVETRDTTRYPRSTSPQRREPPEEQTTPRQRKSLSKVSFRARLFLTTRAYPATILFIRRPGVVRSPDVDAKIFSLISLQLAYRRRDPLAALFYVFKSRGVRKSDMLRGTEVLSRHNCDFGFLEEVIGKVAGGDKLFTVGGFTQQGTNVRKNVECPLRFKTTHAFDCI